MDFSVIERKWQNRWAASRLFEPATQEGRKKFFFTVPYPYVSGSLHVGHGRTYTAGDVIVRFKRKQGYNVLWPMAFHITGTPVLAVSSKVAAKDPDTLQLYRDYVSVYEKPEDVEKIVQSFTEPWNVVNYFSGKLVHDFSRMGFSLDLSRRFTTGDKEYNKFVEWMFLSYQKKGYLKQAAYPLLYCVRDKNAVGEDDIKDGDFDPVEVSNYTGFLFPYDDGFLLSSTFRPDTVFGITNMFVKPDGQYAKVRMDGRILYVSKAFSEKLVHQNHSVVVLSELKGQELLGKTCRTPLGMEVPILPGHFVNPDVASGFVHAVPAHAPFDLVALNDLKKDQKWSKVASSIVPIPVLSVPGFSDIPAQDLVARLKINNQKEKDKLDKATAELYKKEFYEGVMLPINQEFEGQKTEEAKTNMALWLKEKGVAMDLYETSRPALCRCGGQVVAAVMSDQWFIDFSAPGWKDLSQKCLKRMWVYPEVYKKQFEDVFSWLDKRPCARRRGLGTRLPMNPDWIVESLSDSTLYMSFYTIIKKIRELGIKPEQLTPAFFDYVFAGTGEGDEKAAEVRKEFLYWYPNDQRHTAVAHLTNHLSFFIFAHTALLDEKHWPKAITLNELVVSEGSKMSKSSGNVVSLNEISNRFGADLFRLYSVSTADLGATLDFRQSDIESLRKRLDKLYALWDRMLPLAESSPPVQDSPMIRWALSKFAGVVKKSTVYLQDMRLREYALSSFFEALNIHEHVLDRAEQSEAAYIFHHTFLPWIGLLSPLIPHSCEEYWEKAVQSGFISTEPWPIVPAEWSNPGAEASEDFLVSTLSDIQTILRLVRKQPSKITLIVSSPKKLEELKIHLKAARAEDLPETTLVSLYAKRHFYELRHKPMVDEAQVLEKSLPFLEKRFCVPVVVEREESSQNQKREKALPGKPAVYIE